MAACGSSGDSAPAGSKQLTFKLTDEGCSPRTATAPAGPIDFQVENGGTTKYSELEVVDGETILGERENITEGLSGSFSLTLEEGEYIVRCDEQGGEGDGTLKVTGKLKTQASPEVEKAIAGYRTYLEKNTEGTDGEDEAVRRGGRGGRHRGGEAALPRTADQLRADRAGGGELRRPRPADRRA